MDRLFKEYNDNIACVIMEPMNAVWPEEGYLQEVKDLPTSMGASCFR